MSDEYENIDKIIPPQEQEEDHDNLHKNVASMSSMMDNCFGSGGAGTDIPFGSKPPGFMDMIGGTKGISELVNSFAGTLNEMSQRTTRLTGNIDGANFTIDVKNEFTCRMAINILNKMIKDFKKPPTTTYFKKPPTTT